VPRIDQLPAAGFVNTADLVPVARLTGTDPYGNPVWTDYAATFPVTGPVVPAAPSIGRNYFVNGRFRVQQRGPGPWNVAGYTADRWTVLATAAGSRSVALVRLTDADRAAFGDDDAVFALQYAFVGGTGIGDYDQIAQRVDGLRRLSGKTVAISFWARGVGAAFNLGVGTVQYFGTGGTPSATNVSIPSSSVAVTAAWARYVVVVAIPSVAGTTIGNNRDDWTQFAFLFSTGTFTAGTGNVGVQSATAQLRGMQVEVGLAATALEASDPVRDLVNCQSYYQTGQVLMTGYQVAGSAFGGNVPPIVAMRGPPVAVVTSSTNTNLSGFTLQLPAGGFGSFGALYASGNAVVTGPTAIVANYTASAEN